MHLPIHTAVLDMMVRGELTNNGLTLPSQDRADSDLQKMSLKYKC